MDITTRLTFLRTAKGYTVNKLANLSGISQSYLRDIELGKKTPTIEVLSLLCDALEISLVDFFDDSTQRKLTESPLLAKIYRLTPEQQRAVENLIDVFMK